MRRLFPLNFFFCFDSCSVSWRVSDFILRETVGRDCLIKVHQSTVLFFSPLSAQQEPDRLKYAAHCSLTALFIFLNNDAWIPYTSALLSRLALHYCALYSFFSFPVYAFKVPVTTKTISGDRMWWQTGCDTNRLPGDHPPPPPICRNRKSYLMPWLKSNPSMWVGDESNFRVMETINI